MIKIPQLENIKINSFADYRKMEEIIIVSLKNYIEEMLIEKNMFDKTIKHTTKFSFNIYDEIYRVLAGRITLESVTEKILSVINRKVAKNQKITWIKVYMPQPEQGELSLEIQVDLYLS